LNLRGSPVVVVSCEVPRFQGWCFLLTHSYEEYVIVKF